MAEVTVKLGTKLSEQEQQNVDRTKAVWLTAQPPGAGVVGQDFCCQYVICPYCGCIGCAAQGYSATICHCCGRVTRA